MYNIGNESFCYLDNIYFISWCWQPEKTSDGVKPGDNRHRNASEKNSKWSSSMLKVELYYDSSKTIKREAPSTKVHCKSQYSLSQTGFSPFLKKKFSATRKPLFIKVPEPV